MNPINVNKEENPINNRFEIFDMQMTMMKTNTTKKRMNRGLE